MVYKAFIVISIFSLEIRVYKRMCVGYCADVSLKVLDHLEVLVFRGLRTSSSWMLTPKNNCALTWVCGMSKGHCGRMHGHYTLGPELNPGMMEQHQLLAR